MWDAPRMLNYRNQGAPWMLNYPGCTLNFKLQKPGCILKVKSHARAHPAFNFVLLHFMHGHWIPYEAIIEMPMDLYWIIKSCNSPNFYDTCHTFMTLHCIILTACFYKKCAADDQSTFKSESLSCVFVFWLVRNVVHWPFNIWQNKVPGRIDMFSVQEKCLF